jgi:hypothetical protein
MARRKNDRGIVDVAVSGIIAIAITAPVFVTAAADEVANQQDPIIKIGGWAVAIAAISAIFLGLWRTIGRPLKDVLGGRAPRGIEGEPGYDPGAPPLGTFIRDSMHHRDLMSVKIDELADKAHTHP